MNRRLSVLVGFTLILVVLVPGATFAQEPPTVSWLAGTPDNPFWLAEFEGAQMAAENSGINLVMLTTDTEAAIAAQIGQIEDRIAVGDDAMVIAPLDITSLIPSIEAANAAGIPVVAVNKATTAGEYESIVMTDNVKAGATGARAVAELMGGKGKVLLLEGLAGHQVNVDRSSGAQGVFKEYPDLEVIALPADWETAKGQSVTEDVLTGNPDLGGVFAVNDMMAVGAIGAIQAAGKADQIPVVGLDAIPMALEMVTDGRMAATVAQFPVKQGYLAVDFAAKVLNGVPVPAKFDTGSMLVTRDNVGAFQSGLFGR